MDVRRTLLAPVLIPGLLALALPACTREAAEGPEPGADPATVAPADRRVRAVPLEAVEIDDPFWSPRLRTNRERTIPHVFEQNETTGRVDNFRKAAGLVEGPYEGRRFNDTDIYKAIEAASYALARQPDPDLEARIDDLVELIAASQEEDGYLFPARTVDPDDPAAGVGTERWMHVERGSHELYNAGHLFEAAVAHHRATGKRSLLDVAVRLADRIDEDFGPDARRSIPGHEEIELALVKLAEVTGRERYLELARFFLEERGGEQHGEPYPEDSDFAIYNDRAYKQDHVPVVEQEEARGHAVRATYLYIAMTDVAARVPAPDYRAALDRIWHDLVGTKLYLTGGIGARGTFESFGESYELPNRTAYTETCAAVGNDLWNHRMFLASGEARYLDVMERVLYNGALSGVSLAGDSFFYQNPLESTGGYGRSPYFEVACCPANLARLIALLPEFVYGVEGSGWSFAGSRTGGPAAPRADESRGGTPTLYVNLPAGSRARIALGDVPIRIEQRTRYPWEGTVRLSVEPEEPVEFDLAVRVPGWARGEAVPGDLYAFVDEVDGFPTVALNDEPAAPVQAADGFVRIARRWEPGDAVELRLPMPVRRVEAHPAVADDAGKVALQRGPLVYAVEGVDHGGSVLDLALPDDADLVAEWRDDLLGGVTAITGEALRRSPGATDSAEGRRVPLLAIPYFAWANREPGEMAVWLPRAGAPRGEPD